MRVSARVTVFLFLALPPGAGVLAAQDKKDPPKTTDDDPIAAQLLKDKEAYVANSEKAKENMLKAFDKHYESVKANKSLKIDAQLAQLEKIEAEKKAFDETGTPPTLTALKVPLSEYRTAQKKALDKCKLDFEKAAKAYRDKGDVKAAAAVLEEMKEFLARDPAAGAVLPLSIAVQHSGKVLGLDRGSTEDGTKVVTANFARGDQTQLWRIVSAGEGWSYIENVKAAGMVMTANGKGNGTEVVISKKAQPASEFQLWKLTAVPGEKNLFRVVPKPSGRPIGVDSRSKDAGARILLWDDEDLPHRYFGFFPQK